MRKYGRSERVRLGRAGTESEAGGPRWRHSLMVYRFSRRCVVLAPVSHQGSFQAGRRRKRIQVRPNGSTACWRGANAADAKPVNSAAEAYDTAPSSCITLVISCSTSTPCPVKFRRALVIISASVIGRSALPSGLSRSCSALSPWRCVTTTRAPGWRAEPSIRWANSGR